MEQPLPANVSFYEHQVAGHGYSSPVKSSSSPIRRKPQILHSKEEQCVYKPIQAPPKGNREVEFYQMVFGEVDSVDGDGGSPPSQSTRQQLLARLRSFLPPFLGVYRDPTSGVRYIKLQDLLRSFSRPSVMDVKMGARSYEPTASPEKRNLEIAKYSHRHQVGFFVTGLRVWRSGSGDYERYSKRHGKEVTPGNMHASVVPPLFESVPAGHRLRLLRLIIAQLDAMLAWFEAQELFHFYASSILLGVECCPEALNGPDGQHVLVRMVDFTHVVSADPTGSLDEGYLLGLRTLIKLCRACERDFADEEMG